jgi:hypothetical protein
MHSARFDRLAKVLASRHPRRAALSLLAVLGLGLAREEADAKKKNEKKVKICQCFSELVTSCSTKKKAKDKVKKVLKASPCSYKGSCRGVSGCVAGSPGGGTGPGRGTGPGQTCSDGIKNGSETDVDCGGSCPRCANGKACIVANDCISGTCSGGQCIPCTPTQTCGSDAQGQCRCDTEFSSQAPVCDKVEALGFTVMSCNDCPTGTETCVTINGLLFNCYKRCGSP